MEFNVKKITKCAPHTGKSGEYYVVTVSDDNNNMAYAQFTRAQIKSANQIDKLHMPAGSVQDCNCGSTLAKGMKAIIKHHVYGWGGERYNFKKDKLNVALATRDLYSHWDNKKVNSLLATP